jgi:hypothetical protein
MRKLKLQVQMTLDGFVAGPNGELDWMWIGKRDEGILQDVIKLADTCDTILLGRKRIREHEGRNGVSLCYRRYRICAGNGQEGR